MRDQRSWGVRKMRVLQAVRIQRTPELGTEIATNILRTFDLTLTRA